MDETSSGLEDTISVFDIYKNDSLYLGYCTIPRGLYTPQMKIHVT